MRLHRDERGAIMIIGLVMAVFLVATLYYLAGIGQAIVQRERMQDAADAAAFSAATLHARGMNVIVLINMVMAGLLAILVALKLLETLTYVAMVAIAVAGVFAPGLYQFIPPLRALGSEVRQTHAWLRPQIDGSLEALHTLARGVRVAVPAAAQVRTITLVREHYTPPARIGFVLPTRMELPTKDGSFDELCARAGKYVGHLVTLPLAVLVPDAVRDMVAEAVEDLTRGGAGWFCGAGGAPPSATFRYTAQYPMLPSRKACADYDPKHAGYSAARHDALCQQAERDEQAAKPDASGECGPGCDAKLLAQRAELAREACAPRQGHEYTDFSWQQGESTRSFRMHAGQWHALDQPAEPATLVEGGRRPCGTKSSLVGPEWNPAGGSGAGAAPVCSRVDPPLPAGGAEGDQRSVRVTEVTHVFGCKERIEEQRQVQSDGRVSGGAGPRGGAKVPQELASGVELGEEEFQVRAVVLGELPSATPERVIQIASWAATPSSHAEGAALSAARRMGHLAVAQAEFYYAVQHPRAPERGDFMWNMRWQARLRRFRAPEQSSAQSRVQAADNAPGLQLPQAATEPGQACAQAGGAAGDCNGLDLSLQDLVIH